MSDLFGNHIVGFPTRRLICIEMVGVTSVRRSCIFSGGVNNSVVGVCGDSAGGRLAATVSHELSNIVHFAVGIYHSSH